MKIRVNEDYDFVLEDVYEPVFFKTKEGHVISVCMRDNTFEIQVLPGGGNYGNWHTVNMEAGTIEGV